MADLENTLEGLVPLARMRQSEIQEMRRWADAHAVGASFPETVEPQPGNMQVHAPA